MDYKIRAAKEEDCKEVSRMIMELAVFAKMPNEVKTSYKDLQRDGFGPEPLFQCFVAEIPEEHKSEEGFTVVGFAIYFYTYSTWTGPTVYIEDLYVMPDFRGKGIGKALMSAVAKVAKDRRCVRLNLSVLDWNSPARDFYAAKGGQDLTADEGWHMIRFEGKALDSLAMDALKD